jgi:hypothetical protein
VLQYRAEEEEMKCIGLLLPLLLLSSAVSAFAIEPLLAKNKNKETPEAKSFTLQSITGKAYPISNGNMSYPATLTISGEWLENKDKELVSIGKLRVTDGSLTIDGGYYAAKVYKITKGFGINNGKNGKLKILCELQELNSESSYRLILHGRTSSDGIRFEAPESRIATQYFVEFSGQLTK